MSAQAMLKIEPLGFLCLLASFLPILAGCSEPVNQTGDGGNSGSSSSTVSTGGAGGTGGEGGGAGGTGGTGGSGGSGVCSPSAWVIKSIDVAMQGSQPDLVIDKNDQIWISYFEANSTTLQVARSVADGFQVETVDTGNVGGDSKLVFVGDVPHIIYKDYGNLAVKHAAYESGAWNNEVIESATANGLSLVADANGMLHASFYVQDDVQYATNASGTWTIEVVNTAFQPGANTTLALLNGTPEIVYTQRQNNIYYQIYHASRVDAMNWSKTNVISSYMFDVTNPFLVDATGERHIFPATLDGLVHLKGKPANWINETIKPSSVALSATLDAKGVFHVAHIDIGAQALSYSNNATGSFQTTEVDAMSLVTSGSLGVDSTGRVHIAYHDLKSKHLMYATACP